MRRFLILFLMLLPLGTAIGQQPNDDALAAQFFQSGDYEKASILYQKLFAQTKNPAYYDPLFTSLLKLKRYEEAEQLVRRQLKSSPQNYIYSVDLGRILQERGDKVQ